MKRWIGTMVVLGVLVGCSSTPDEQKPATIEDRKPTIGDAGKAAPVKPTPEATARPTKPQTVGADPLKDPANILSRRSIFFDYDQFTVKEEFKPVVSAHARYLSQNRQARATIQGNTDERGSREYNLALGQKRAEAVRQMMRLSGAADSQIEAVSFGEEKPKALGHDEASWAENRRSDVVYQRGK